jgi:uncharacterized membrane protein YcaP (DUF421 family)
MIRRNMLAHLLPASVQAKEASLMTHAWYEMFVPTHSLLAIIARGSIMYLAIFLLLRFVLKRQTGGLSTPDILLVVLLADAAQNGMANEYRSITEGIVLICTIIFWNFAIDWLEFHAASCRVVAAIAGPAH